MSAQEAAESTAEAPAARAVAEVLAGFHPLARVWLYPITGSLEVVTGTVDKPVGALTMIELMAWASVLGYAALSGYVAGRIAGNVAAVALRGPARR